MTETWLPVVGFEGYCSVTVKRFLTGSGGATKSDMRMAWYRRTGQDVRDDNQVDAAVCRAIGLQLAGRPWLKVPANNVAALRTVHWPLGVAS